MRRDTEVDFTLHKHPVLAVACPTCRAAAGVWCRRPSEHAAWDLHADRKRLADQVFIDRHGAAASIELTPAGWVVDPHGRAAAAQGELLQGGMA